MGRGSLREEGGDHRRRGWGGRGPGKDKLIVDTGCESVYSI